MEDFDRAFCVALRDSLSCSQDWIEKFRMAENPSISDLMSRLERVLKDLWLSEFGWNSIEVFAPVYDLLCELMALHGMAFARHGDEWRVVMSDEPTKTPELKAFLLSKVRESH